MDFIESQPPTYLRARVNSIKIFGGVVILSQMCNVSVVSVVTTRDMVPFGGFSEISLYIYEDILSS